MASSPAIATFRADGHVYEFDGVVVPSVTQAMQLAGLDDLSRAPRHFVERAGAIGTAVHQACHFLDECDLDLDSLDPLIVGYVLGYQRFKEQHNFEPVVIEQRGLSVDPFGGLPYGFCLDRIGTIGGVEILIEIKTASRRYDWWRIQTAAYASAVNFTGPRFEVHLAKTGTYKFNRHAQDGDFAEWDGILREATEMLANGAQLPQ
jgi:hypothetical protein